MFVIVIINNNYIKVKNNCLKLPRSVTDNHEPVFTLVGHDGLVGHGRVHGLPVHWTIRNRTLDGNAASNLINMTYEIKQT